MNLEIRGRLIEVYPVNAVNERLMKREFVVEIKETNNDKEYISYAKFQLVNARCNLVDRFKQGDVVKVSFNIRGNKYEKDGRSQYISNLDAWKIEQG